MVDSAERKTGSESGNSEITRSDANIDGNQGFTLKRGRGRPKGSKNRRETASGSGSGNGSETAKEGYAQAVFKEEKVTLKGKGKKPVSFMSENDAKQTTLFLLTLVEGTFTQQLGDAAKFNSIESLLLTTSLPNILQNMSDEAAAKMLNFLYPLALVIGSSSYSYRLLNLYREKQEKIRKEKEESEQNANDRIDQ